ncbi:MAG: hypothetical protein M3Y87_19330 [Myxococcota bacterium]|nr:hypothetical protein [Myxococcota bacterium]
MSELRDVAVAGSMLLAALGCAPEETVPLCDAEAAAGCLVDQRGCELQEGAPACVPCAAGTRADLRGACAPIPGTAMSHAFPEVESAAGEEIIGLCRSWTLGNETELWVHAVELRQDEASHHSNWMFVPDDFFDGPDGVWPCAERDYHQLNAALAGGVLYAQSTQAEREVQLFPEGAAIRLPPHARIISDVHVLNTTAETIRGHADLAIYTIPREQVTIPLAPFHIDYHALDIPARSHARFVTECALRDEVEAATGMPFRMRLHYALPHTHALGTRVFLQAIGGPRDGEMLLDVSGYNGEARGRFYEPPIDLDGITGLRFGCEFMNPRAESVQWGFDDQEMCEMLGFLESAAAFESRVSETTSMRMDGEVHEFSGNCESFIIPWDDRHGT